MASEGINCSKCIHYYITWDSSFPRGCKLYGFKTKNIPSILVKQSSGISCGNFTPK
ncbi:MAG: uracil-DNA glycosylase [Clostridium sp.]|uniref:uracil-DNA glycosylase n=1 Tax=Clostridium sp. TaxID=1506 RepID=UPI003D6D1F39